MIYYTTQRQFLQQTKVITNFTANLNADLHQNNNAVIKVDTASKLRVLLYRRMSGRTSRTRPTSKICEKAHTTSPDINRDHPKQIFVRSLMKLLSKLTNKYIESNPTKLNKVKALVINPINYTFPAR